MYDKCELLIRTPNGRIVSLGKIVSTHVQHPTYKTKLMFGQDIAVVSCDTRYTFDTIERNTGDYDGDDYIGYIDGYSETNYEEWENIIRSDTYGQK